MNNQFTIEPLWDETARECYGIMSRDFILTMNLLNTTTLDAAVTALFHEHDCIPAHILFPYDDHDAFIEEIRAHPESLWAKCIEEYHWQGKQGWRLEACPYLASEHTIPVSVTREVRAGEVWCFEAFRSQQVARMSDAQIRAAFIEAAREVYHGKRPVMRILLEHRGFNALCHMIERAIEHQDSKDTRWQWEWAMTQYRMEYLDQVELEIMRLKDGTPHLRGFRLLDLLLAIT